MVNAIILTMLAINILQISSASVDVPGKTFKEYIDHLKHRHPDDNLSPVRRINHMLQSLMQMTKLDHGQKQDKSKSPTSVNFKTYRMYRRFYFRDC